MIVETLGFFAKKHRKNNKCLFIKTKNH